jgi:hypothetical protein
MAGTAVRWSRRHADRARSPASRWPTPDAPAGRLPHNLAPGGRHRCCEHTHRHHSSQIGRACLVRPDTDLVHGLPTSRRMPLGRRELRGRRASPSVDGGLLLVRRSFARVSSSSLIRAFAWANCFFKGSSSATNALSVRFSSRRACSSSSFVMVVL